MTNANGIMTWQSLNVVLLFGTVWKMWAAISVRPNGTGISTFDTLPSATEWSTATLYGASSDVTTPAQLDRLVHTNAQCWTQQSVAKMTNLAPSDQMSRQNAALQNRSPSPAAGPTLRYGFSAQTGRHHHS
jgi:hypothetical protein